MTFSLLNYDRNISGLAPGKLADLNVNGEFFIGGHETYNFTQLPHDLPLHTGFTGCIFDLVITDDDGKSLVPVPQRGRNVQQCHERICDTDPCHGELVWTMAPPTPVSVDPGAEVPAVMLTMFVQELVTSVRREAPASRV